MVSVVDFISRQLKSATEGALARLSGRRLQLSLLISVLVCLPFGSFSACSIDNPGQPTVGGIPLCPCGQVYVTSLTCSGPVPSMCSNCEPYWTGVGCFNTPNTTYTNASLNIRCSCTAGACCITSGPSSGIFQYPGVLCNASTGPCQNDSVCTGSNATCPALTFMPANTVCNATSGPCQNSAMCNGTSALCPAKTQIPSGGSCGNNTQCSTFSNNTCDAVGECLIAQCATCPNGMEGADCSCPGGPPTASMGPLNATCSNGTWLVTGNIDGTLTIQPGTNVIINGTLHVSSGSSIIVGAGSFTNITNCANITGTLTGLYSPKFAHQSAIEFATNCSFVQPLLSSASIASNGQCTSVTTSTTEKPGTLNVLFTTTTTTCKKKFNYLAYVVAPVVSVAAVTAIILAVVLPVQHFKWKRISRVPTMLQRIPTIQ